MAINIDTPIQYLKGVGPKLGDILAKRDIRSVNDLLEWYPRAYEDRRAAQNISDLVPGRMVSLKAQVVQVRSAFLGRSRRKMYEIVVQDKSGRISCKYFRVPYKGYFERFESGSLVRIIGKVTEYRSRREFHHPDIHVVQIDEVDENRLVPLYTETEGLSFQKLNRLLNSALEQLTQKSNSGIPDPFPSWIREKYQLVSRSEALTQIHHPPLHEAGEFLKFRSPSQRRLIFEEFFWMELNLAFRRSGIQKENAPPIITEESKLSQLTQNLPFALTSAQRRSAQEIIKDLRKPHPMHRLLQGDVGSGKTLVALLSSVYSAFAGFQSALMVPTEILAEQHFQNAQRLLAPLNFRVGLLTGSMKPKEREEVLSQLQSGEVHLCIGTHALIQENVKFQKLGLVIIDEQHRFGVQQRHLLKQKGVSPHFLVMTATPIPRTLALSVYGDLDVSVIDEMPKGRQPIVTRKAYESKRGQVFEFVRGQLAKGRQAYVVYPLIEESEKMDLKNAMEEFENLKQAFPGFRLGLLHGKMKSAEKDEVMHQFRKGEMHLLVSTTVIEVGVDVPNASVMVIEHAERFGLSQLHQLRGRVGRGGEKSYCILVLGHALSEVSLKRAEIMEQTNDGFKISEADLELRGPGEFLGTRQSGLPGFKMANLFRDVLLLQEAREAAFELVHRDPSLQLPEHRSLKEVLEQKDRNYLG